MTEREIASFIVENDRLVWYIARGPLGRSVLEDPEDLAQELRERLVIALRRYDSDAGVPLVGYAGVCMRRHLRRMHTNQNRGCRAGYLHRSSLDATSEGGESLGDQVEDETCDVEEAALASAESALVLRAVSEREAGVLVLRSHGFNFQEISGRIGVSRQRVQQIEVRALEKARQRLKLEPATSRL